MTILFSRTITLFSCLAAALLILGLASEKAAAGGIHDHVYADSFGNLVIHSPSGYKRIVVGEGHLARELSAWSRGEDPKVVYAQPRGEDRGYSGYRRCDYGVLLHGRSYMYGLPDNSVPVLRHPSCR